MKTEITKEEFKKAAEFLVLLSDEDRKMWNAKLLFHTGQHDGGLERTVKYMASALEED